MMRRQQRAVKEGIGSMSFSAKASPLLGGIALTVMAIATTPASAQATDQADPQTATRNAAPATAPNEATNAVAAPSAAESTGGDIVVTAQKRSQRLQDVPVAVTALGADALASAQVNSSAGIAALVPSLTYTQNTSPLNNNVRVRGVGTNLFSAGIESSVSFVVDGVVLARQGQGFTDLIDVDRVEVLRGPQGTLFGKNATAGVVSIVTKAPSDHLEGAIEGTAAEQNEYRLRGTISGPLAEGIKARLTGYYTNDGGWATNASTGKDVFGTKDWGLRGKVAIDAASNFDLLVIGDYSRSNSTCCQPLAYQQGVPLLQQLRSPIVPSIDNRTVLTTTNTFSDVKTGGASVEANLQLGDHKLTSITAWREWDFSNNVDVDGLANPSPVRVPFGFGWFGVNGGTVGIKQTSEEVRLTSPSGGLFEYTLGGMYYHLDLDRGFQRRVAGCPGDMTIALGATCPNPLYQSSGSTAHETTDNYAAFGQLQLNVTSKLSALGGFRLQRERVAYNGTRPGTAPFASDTALLGGSSGANSVSDTDLSGKVGLQYKFSRHAQAYASWTRGYKGYGWDIEFSANFASQKPVKPETVSSWEIGFKGQALDNRLTANIALFDATYTNLQVQATQLVNGAPISIPTNAGSSNSKGVELEVNYRPVEKLTLFGGLTYMHARFDADGLPCRLPDQASPATVALGAAAPTNACFRLNGAAVQNVRDGLLPNSPDFKANASIRYEDSLTRALDGFIQVNGTYQSRVLFDLSQDQALDQHGYGTVDLSLGVRDKNRGYEVTFFVRNLANEHFVNGKQRDNILTNAANPGNILFFTSKNAVRYVGGMVRFNF
jgi:iron complex outermembrane receptor protein